MKIILISILTLWSSVSLACWSINGKMVVAGEKIPVHQKFNPGESYSFMKGDYIVHLQVKKMIHFEVVKKENLKLTQVSKGIIPVVNEWAQFQEKNFKLRFKVEHI